VQPSDSDIGAGDEHADVVDLGGTIRFNVSDGSRRSATRRVWTARHADDVYAAARLVAGDIKISLHESGSWQHGFASDDKAHGFRVPRQSRHFSIWQRPEEIVPGWTRAVRIIIPDAALQIRPAPGTARRPVIDLLASYGGDATIAEIWLESATNQAPQPLKGGTTRWTSRSARRPARR
jgi:hypothetical protein